MRSVHDLLRLARRLHVVYERRLAHHDRDQQSEWARWERRVQEAQRHHRLVGKARAHGWHVAASLCQQDLCTVLRACNEATSEMYNRRLESPGSIPSLRDLFAELQHLDQEFDDVILDARKPSLAIQTQPIVLKGINFGPFLLRLHWPRLAERADIECFDVVALEPNPAGRDQDVTHPHVKDDRLCTGDATIPLQKALEQGRLVDAFCLLRSVLENYNPQSAYVALENWDGVSCWNCGYAASEDDAFYCESCSHDVCSDCISRCQQCDCMFCSSCQSRCSVCDGACCERCLQKSACSEMSCCASCLVVCSSCAAEVASSELDEESTLCPTCRDKQTTDANAPSENDASQLVSSS